ncbi:MAG TPA: tail fiber domain-containing protein [Candidatus Baltobacteraceae bacterium]|nr:tail fiber domain-containing protein [Candidatus Baltobacteraceae bacterium]
MRVPTSLCLVVLLAGCAAGAAELQSSAPRAATADGRKPAASGTVKTDGNTTSCSESCATLAGNGNSASGDYSVVAGGDTNSASGEFAFVGSGRNNVASGIAATISGGGLNVASGYVATVGGGSHQNATGYKSTISGGTENTADAMNSTIGGGLQNAAHGDEGFIGGGSGNTVSGQYGTIGGGGLNTAGQNGTVAGGYKNNAGAQATISGGYGNTANGIYSVVPGGYGNSAAGRFSLAAGYRSQAAYDGDFVWSDSDAEASSLSASAANQFVARAEGGYALYTNRALTTGVVLAPGSGAWASTSDRRDKRNVRGVDGRLLLHKLDDLNVSAWSYRSEGDVRHIGPMAQDFHAAFGLGPDDTHITSIDEDGVALAAIKALHRELSETRGELARTRAQLSRLEADVRRLER